MQSLASLTLERLCETKRSRQSPEKGGTELSAAPLSFMSLERAAEGGGGAQHAPRMRSSESRGMIDLDLVILLD